MSQEAFDYDLVIIGAGVGGHGAALHAVSCGLKTAIVEAADMGGTCVNRGCIPSKALLAAAGRVRELRNAHHLKALGIHVGDVAFDRAAIADHANNLVSKIQGALNFTYQVICMIRNAHHLKALGIHVGDVAFDRAAIADHANNLVSKIQGDLTNSLKRLGVDIIRGWGKVAGQQKVTIATDNGEKTVTAKDIILSPGSVPFVPPGIEVDGKTVFTSDQGVKLESLPDWVAIIGSGYIGLEFSDVYSALGSEVTMIEALDQLMPGFDRDIAKLAERILITPRDIETHVGIYAKRVIPGSPVVIELADFKTKEEVDVIEVDACLVATGRIPVTQNLGLDSVGVELDRRNFIPVDDRMAVLSAGEVVPHLWAIGDANGKMMLAHAASAQGITAVENICGRHQEIDYRSIPAAAFTHPEISYVGMTETAAKDLGKEQGFEVGAVRTYFKGNSKALAEGEADGIAKLVYRKDTGEVLGVHILGMHASDLIHEASAAIANRQSVHTLAHLVHAHPTLSEVLDEAYKRAIAS